MTERSRRPPAHLRGSDLRGVARLATDATLGVARITEGVHQSVLRTLGARGKGPERTGGLTGLIYQSVQGITRGVGKGLDIALGAIEPLFGDGADALPASPQREAVLAALNGVMGDRLAAAGSPFATPMTLRYQGDALDLTAPLAVPGAGAKLLVMVHGLCMNDLQWRTSAADASAHDHGQWLATALGYTPVYLRYNTGLHTSQNGRELASLLERCLDHWPVAIEEISILAHSMGGLVARSAVHSAREQGLHWPQKLRHLVFLGTPHHGAPLERAGHGVDLILAGTPWSRPFTRLVGLRSAGITDLRHGHVRDEDWQGHDRFGPGADARLPLPLPDGVACHTAAATTAAKRGPLADRLIGDGLVPLNSALGRHADPHHALGFDDDAQWIAYRTGHLALLSSLAVAQQVRQWLAAPSAGIVSTSTGLVRTPP